MECDPLVKREMEKLMTKMGSWKAVAEHFGVHPTFISNIMSGVAEPSFRICRSLGLKRVVTKTVTYEEIIHEG